MSTFRSRELVRLCVAIALITSLVTAAPAVALAGSSDRVSVIVQKLPGFGNGPEHAVAALGGHVDVDLSIINGFTATLERTSLSALERTNGVRFVTVDESVRLMSEFEEGTTTSTTSTTMPEQATEDPDPVSPSDVTSAPADSAQVEPAVPDAVTTTPPPAETAPADESVYQQEIGADVVREQGTNGNGVTVALIDTGVAAIPDLAGVMVPVVNRNGSIKSCVNLSGESNCKDSYGHGTFIAGLIAGNGAASNGRYAGVAPGAKILSVKIAGRDGSASVGKILFAIQWVVSHKSQYGIKVLNLSLGTDSPQSYRHDPLNYAVERAWARGITVVVSAGNRGPTAGTISKPADDPYVITAGAVDDVNTPSITDDVLPDFSSRGPTIADGLVKPDVTAPGARLVSLRSPGSAIEEQFPGGGIDSVYRRGSGTSQSAAVVSGSVALLLSQHTSMTPNQVKYALMHSADAVASAGPDAVGAGMLDIDEAINNTPVGEANQGLAPAFGDGSLWLSQGSVRVVAKEGSQILGQLGNVVPVRGYDYGDPSDRSWYGTGWYGSGWYGSGWYGSGWYGVWS